MLHRNLVRDFVVRPSVIQIYVTVSLVTLQDGIVLLFGQHDIALELATQFLL